MPLEVVTNTEIPSRPGRFADLAGVSFAMVGEILALALKSSQVGLQGALDGSEDTGAPCRAYPRGQSDSFCHET